MNCHDIERLLVEGKVLTPEAEAHVQSCPGCRLLLEVLSQSESPVSPDVLNKITGSLTSQLVPVKRLPSDRTLILFLFGIFAVFCFVLAIAVGLFGYDSMTLGERAVYYSPVGIFGLLFAMTMVAAGIPAATERVPALLVTVGSAIAIALAVSVIFPRFGLQEFVKRGIPCLRFGCMCAAIFGLILAFVLRYGYVTDRQRTAVLAGCFGGFSGVAVLSLHCPLQNAAHIIVWHLGAMAVGALGGALAASVLEARTGQG